MAVKTIDRSKMKEYNIYAGLGWDRDDEDPELVEYANEVFDSYMEDWIEYCAIPTDEDTETDKEDLIRDYIIEDDNNTCETGCE